RQHIEVEVRKLLQKEFDSASALRNEIESAIPKKLEAIEGAKKKLIELVKNVDNSQVHAKHITQLIKRNLAHVKLELGSERVLASNEVNDLSAMYMAVTGRGLSQEFADSLGRLVESGLNPESSAF